jgi:alkanesulfonate monooxygenase SsuD/methylene tetrahydromethanopterin reductase-like flavin-dependent oxidoreductase (luciferase family)
VKERQDRLEEAVALIRMLFEANGPVNFSGKHYRLKDAMFVPKCVQAPHPPIMVGGAGEKRTLRTLAKYGDVMNISGTPDIVRQKIGVLEQHCRDVGRNPADIKRTVFGTIVVSDNAGFIDRVAGMFGAGMGLTPDAAKRQLPIGDGAHVREVVERYAEAGVTEMIMSTQGPWKREVYERINREVVAPLA